MATALAIGTLSACANGSTTSDDSAASREFTYWSMFKMGEPGQVALATIIDEFEKDTGITVDAQWVGRDVLTKLQPTLSTSPAADLIDRPLWAVESVMVPSGTVADLEPVLDMEIPGSDETVRDVIPETYLEVARSKDGAQVVIPWTMTSYDIWYDSARFPDLVSTTDLTWDRFVEVLDDSRTLGAPLALDADILGYSAYWYNNAVLHTMGPGAMNKAAGDKTGKTWDESGYRDAADRIQQLVAGGYFAEGYNASKFPAIQQKWASGEANFILNGSWLPGEAAPNAAEGFEFASIPFPADEPDSKYAATTAYGWVIPSKSTNPGPAEQFIAYAYGKERAQAYADETSVISARADVTESAAVASAAATLENADKLVLDDDGISQSYGGDWSTKVYQPLVAQLLTGGLDAEKFIAEIKQQTVSYWELNQ